MSKIHINVMYRDTSGRYSVRLPFKTRPPDINNSHNLSVQRLYNVEHFLSRNIEVYK